MPAKHLKGKPRPHISPEEIAAFVNHRTSESGRELIIEHLAHCPKCRRIVSKVAQSQTAVEGGDSRQE